MIFSERFDNITDIALISIMIFFLIVDLSVSFLLKVRHIPISNNYYRLHEKYGFLKITICKIIISFIIGYAILTHQPSSGGLAAPIIVHAAYVARQVIELLRKNKDQDITPH